MPFPFQSTIDAIQSLFPTADSAANASMSDVIGNKTDTVGGDSLVALIKILDTAVDAIQTDLGNPSGRTNLQTILALLGNPDIAGKSIYEFVKNIREVAVDGSSIPLANTLSDILHKDGSYTYDNTTDSLEAISDSIASGVIEIEADAGTTATNIIDAAALTQGVDDWWQGATLVSVNGQNAGQARPIVSFDVATDSLDVYPAFLNTPDAGDDFLLISSWRPHVFDQQPAVAVSVAANIAAVDIFDLNTAGVTYMVNSLILKAADPGAETITVKLKELINDVSTVVDTFAITTANYATYFSLYDMFSRHHLAGDDIQVTIEASADNAYALTGQYQYAQAYTG